MIDINVPFLDERRLIHGPWQAFERDVARLLVSNGFEHVRLVGGTGDHGGDILGAVRGELWVFQCKYTSNALPPRGAVSEIVEAGRYYGASHMVVATSRPPGEALLEDTRRYGRLGVKVDVAEPRVLLRLMAQTPEYPGSRKKLRDYQEEICARFRDALVDTGRALVVLATGLGKTIVMAEVVADLLRDGLIPCGRVLVLGHTLEIVNQLHTAFWYQLPKWVPTHQLAAGEAPAHYDGVTFATIQSARAQLHLLPGFGLVLVDEAHHVGAHIFQDTVQALRPRMLGGVTATPWRGDGYALEQILGPPLVRIGIAEGLRRGFLSEVDYRLLADNVDWQFVQARSKHRYSLSQLNRQLIIPTRDEEAAKIIKELFDSETRKAGIVFSPSVVHANVFSAMLRRYGFRSETISSATPARERFLLLSQFRSGRLDIVTTVDLFNEGIDIPDVDLIVFMRATHSRRIFVQQLGRGLRISPCKERVLVLDFVTDLRRVAEVVQLERAVSGGDVERLGLGGRLVQFNNKSAGDFLREWMLDQASLFLREGDPTLEMPQFEFPEPLPPGGVQ